MQPFQFRCTHQNYNTTNLIVSPREGSNELFFSPTNESPKNTLSNTNGFNETKMLLTNNSKYLNLRKYNNISTNGFNTLNTNTTSSKLLTINSTSSSMLPISTYISTSSLQTGIASYSIPRTKRFKNTYKSSYCDTIYNLPDFRSTGISIGNGKRKDLFDKNKGFIPSTHDYVFTSVFDDNLNKKKGASMAGKSQIRVNIVLHLFNLVIQNL